jgi:hypothetical protein
MRKRFLKNLAQFDESHLVIIQIFSFTTKESFIELKQIMHEISNVEEDIKSSKYLI